MEFQGFSFLISMLVHWQYIPKYFLLQEQQSGQTKERKSYL